jgi:hypothetical protein
MDATTTISQAMLEVMLYVLICVLFLVLLVYWDE